MASVIAEQTVVGNVGGIYELRHVGKDNRAVIDFSVAVTPRVLDGNDWKDGDTTWVSVTAWGRLAENIEKSFRKGDRVFVKGRVVTKPEFTKDDGTVIPARPILTADYAGLEIGFDSASSDRVARGGTSENRNNSGNRKATSPARKATPKPAPADDDLDLDLDLDLDDDDISPF